MVLKGVIWVHSDKMMSNGLERSQLGTQYSFSGAFNGKCNAMKSATLFTEKRNERPFARNCNPMFEIVDI